MTRPQTLTTAQLEAYGKRIETGGLDAAKQVYSELFAQGYTRWKSAA